MNPAWFPFIIVAITLVGSAIKVVSSKDLVHSVLWLALMLIGTAVLFVTLHADFLAAVQILLYTGGVITLMLFAIMLTQRLTTAHIAIASTDHLRGAVALLSVGILLVTGIVHGAGAIPLGEAPPVDTQALGKLFLTELILPFEVLSILLLAAMIAAITLARRTDP
jgi:NAD(P)H-quinone oxidoreductase subunit 6